MGLDIKSIIRNKLGNPNMTAADDILASAYTLGWIATFRTLELRARLIASKLKELLDA